MRTNWKNNIATKLGVVAMAGVGIGMAGSANADVIAIGDQGFEDHVIDDPSGYSYGAALQAGDADGWNNPSSDNGLSSPWLSLDNNGVGIGGDNASFMYTAAYSPDNYPDPIGNQAIEIQSLLAQGLVVTYQANTDYKFTVAAGDSGDPTLVLRMYDATTLSAPSAKEDITTASSTLASPVFSVTEPPTGPMGDYSYTFTAASIATAGLVGQNIGIAIGDENLADQGVGIDNVRLESLSATAVPEPGSLAVLSLGALGFLSRRRRDR